MAFPEVTLVPWNKETDKAEPGLYISDRLAVPEGQPEIDDRWKGIGIRIEDDVAVMAVGHEVLTAAALKSVEAMER